jgi:hypothetical protein
MNDSKIYYTSAPNTLSAERLAAVFVGLAVNIGIPFFHSEEEHDVFSKDHGTLAERKARRVKLTIEVYEDEAPEHEHLRGSADE